MFGSTLIPSFHLNWYDYIAVVVLIFGIWNGVRTGLTGELIRLLGFIMMVVVPLSFYQPLGGWLRELTTMVREVANLVAFVGLAVVVISLTHGLRFWLRRRTKKAPPAAAFVENTGGAIAGAFRVLAVMVCLTIGLCLMRSPFWHQQVARESWFGSNIVCRLPDVEAVTKQKYPENFLLFRDLTRPDEPDVEHPTRKR